MYENHSSLQLISNSYFIVTFNSDWGRVNCQHHNVVVSLNKQSTLSTAQYLPHTTDFLLRVKYGMSEKEIGRRAEPMMHIITTLFGLGTSFLCLGLNLFNDSTLWCWVNASPKGCKQSYANNGETNCERGDNAEIYRWAIFFAPLWACIVGCMMVMIIIFISVRNQENKLKKYRFKTRRESENSATDARDKEFERKKREDERRRHAQSRQVAWQGLRFVGVFYLTWAFATVNRLLQLFTGSSYFWLMCLHTMFVPLQG